MTVSYRLLSGAVAAALVVTLFAGCTTNGERNRTTTGALTGSVLGAGAGALIDKDNPFRGALIGAAAGGAIGGGVGHVLQRQKVALDRIEGIETQQQTVLVQQPVPQTTTPATPGAPAPAEPQVVTVERPALLLRMQNDVLFPVGSSALSEAGRAKIREIATVLQDYPDSDVYVRGYTSAEGADDMNFELSQRRAQVVANELVGAGIDPRRIDARGMGESNPIASNDTESGRIQNRRVEINIVPRGEAATTAPAPTTVPAPTAPAPVTTIP